MMHVALAVETTGWQVHKVSLRTLKKEPKALNLQSAQADFVNLPAREFIRQGSRRLEFRSVTRATKSPRRKNHHEITQS